MLNCRVTWLLVRGLISVVEWTLASDVICWHHFREYLAEGERFPQIQLRSLQFWVCGFLEICRLMFDFIYAF